MDFIFAYILTLTVETFALLIILHKRYSAKTIVLNAIIASSITLPFVWFVFPFLDMSWNIQLAIAEMFAFLCEAVFYKKMFAKIGWKDAMLASLVCNCLSFGIGLLLSF